MNITIEEPETDPMIHHAFPGGIEDLKEYVLELKGFKDHWVKNMNDPKDTRWEYTYHGRLAEYGSWKERLDGEGSKSVDVGFKIDQIERPERPIPKGEVPLKGAALFGSGLLLSGVFLSFFVNQLSGIIAVILALTIILYDYYSKKYQFLGPLNMGL